VREEGCHAPHRPVLHLPEDGRYKLSDTRVCEPQIRARLGTTQDLLGPVTRVKKKKTKGRYKATWKRKFKLPWREAGPPKQLVIYAVLSLGFMPKIA